MHEGRVRGGYREPECPSNCRHPSHWAFSIGLRRDWHRRQHTDHTPPRGMSGQAFLMAAAHVLFTTYYPRRRVRPGPVSHTRCCHRPHSDGVSSCKPQHTRSNRPGTRQTVDQTLSRCKPPRVDPPCWEKKPEAGGRRPSTRHERRETRDACIALIHH